MKMTPCESSQIAAHGYDPDKGVMVLHFKDGKGGIAEYRYHRVPQAAYDALCSAPSIGSHVHAHIKPHFKFSKMEKPHDRK